MPKFVFKIPGSPVVYGPRRGEFIWNEAYSAFVFNGKPTYPEQFNATFRHVFEAYRDETPSVEFFDDPPLSPHELCEDAISTLRQLSPQALASSTLRSKVGQRPTAAATSHAAITPSGAK
jgi:hypothetical protein